MAQQQANLEFSSFVSGLITEASPLSFPDNASLDEENMVLNREGSRQRRLGMDYENSYAFTASPYTNGDFQATNTRVTFFRWDNVANDSGISLGVVQIGINLYFLDLYSSNPSANLKNGGSAFTPTGLDQGEPISFTSIGGKLVGVYGTNKFYVFTYDPDTDTISSSTKTPNVRDIWGVDDGLDVDERPSSLSSRHRYNIHNQGWPNKNYRDDAGDRKRPHVHFYNQFDATEGGGVYPSNADIWYLGQQPDGSTTKFEGRLIDLTWFGKTRAPRGQYIIDMFNRSTTRASESGISTSLDVTYGGFTASATYAGRLFLSGIRVDSVGGSQSTAPRLESFVIFSQVSDNDDKLDRFYQEADPTQQDTAGLVATDGGTITIPEASRIYRLISTGRLLVVLAENGIWTISGSDEGFSATNYQVTKVSNIGVINSDSVIEAEGAIFYWSKAGIYLLSPDQVTGNLVPKNITEATIQTLYADIPSVGKAFAKGIYDEAARKVRWLYNDQDDYNGLTYVDHYNKELILDLTLNAFYKHSIPAGYNSVSVCDFVSTPNYLGSTSRSDVIQGVDDIVIAPDDVIISENVRSRGTSTTKYLTVRPGTTNAEFTLSQYQDAQFLDWFTEDGVGTDAAAYLETGYFTGGDSSRDKWAKYVVVHCKRTETGYELDGSGNIVFDTPSSCLVQGRWDFSDSVNSGKWSDQFQAYRLNRLYIPSGVGDSFDYGYDIITTKNKVRGNGRALRVRFDTEAGKDLYLYGWGITMSQNADV